MTIRSYWLGAAAIAGLALAPTGANAQLVCGSSTYSFSLGLGGSLNGCFLGTLSQLGEDAGFISQQYFWAGNFGSHTGATNAPTVAGTFMYSDDCGSDGNGTFAFCTGSFVKPPAVISNASGEMVLGLLVPDNSYGTGVNWVYSGARARNDTPAPAGFQSVLLQLTVGGVDSPGRFLFGWEDVNTGCIARVAANNNRFRVEDLGNGTILDSRLDDCITELPGGISDSDFNDSYMLFTITGTGVPADIGVAPEPMTMSLLAMGLVGMGGASLSKRRKK